MTNLNQDMQDVLNNLTAEERNLLKKATLKDWVTAISELVTERSFWEGILNSFLEGMNRGLEKNR